MKRTTPVRIVVHGFSSMVRIPGPYEYRVEKSKSLLSRLISRVLLDNQAQSHMHVQSGICEVTP